MQPRVTTKSERRLLLSYQLPHRIHCASILPTAAPNDSTVIIYGHSSGLRTLWRGGRRRKEQSASTRTPNGASNSDVIELGEGDSALQSIQSQRAADDIYDVDEEELDPDCQYHGFVQDVDLPMEFGVLHIASPRLQESETSQNILSLKAVVAVALTNGAVNVLQIPLQPPSSAEKDGFVKNILESQIPLSAAGTPVFGLSIKLVTNPGPDQLLVSFISNDLTVATFLIEPDGLSLNAKECRKFPLPSIPRQISINPSPRMSHILVTDLSGAVRVLDPYALQPGQSTDSLTGRWVMSYLAPYTAPKKAPQCGAVQRKAILAAQWVSGGRRILVLLADGEWGLWDISSTPPTGRSINDFTLRGYLSTSPADTADATIKPKKGYFNLAPTTPTTRKAKEESLFSGASKTAGAPARGGISVSTNSLHSGSVPDESVIMWYNSEVYSISSFQSFLQRSTANDGSGFGSLHTPGLALVPDINLSNESITTISQFTATTSGLGQMNVQRDLLISAEYQALILQSNKLAVPPRNIFQQSIAERPASRDQKMLDAGELDLGGVDRLLDSMATHVRPPGRRVGFVD